MHAAPLAWIPSKPRERSDDLFMLADSLKARACCLLRLTPNDHGSVVLARGLSDDRQDTLIVACAGIVSGATGSGTHHYLPWVLDKQNGNWVSSTEAGSRARPSSSGYKARMTVALFSTDRAQVEVLVLVDVPWTLQSAEFRTFHSEGLIFLSQRKEPAPQSRRLRLSANERNCLAWCACGKTSFEISKILSLSEHTVNHYFSIATAKLEARNRSHAVAKAIKSGLINLIEVT